MFHNLNKLAAYPKQYCKLMILGLLTIGMAGSCQSSRSNQQHSKASPSQDTVTVNNASTVDTTLMKLKKFAGAYPSDVHFLDQPEIKQRIETLMGSQYSNLRKYWQTETPIEVEDSVLSTTGCEAHNCAANQFVLQIDLAHNNINVYHLGQGIQSYLEKGPIILPPGLSKEFQTISSNNQQ